MQSIADTAVAAVQALRLPDDAASLAALEQLLDRSTPPGIRERERQLRAAAASLRLSAGTYVVLGASDDVAQVVSANPGSETISVVRLPRPLHVASLPDSMRETHWFDNEVLMVSAEAPTERVPPSAVRCVARLVRIPMVVAQDRAPTGDNLYVTRFVLMPGGVSLTPLDALDVASGIKPEVVVASMPPRHVPSPTPAAAMSAPPAAVPMTSPMRRAATAAIARPLAPPPRARPPPSAVAPKPKPAQLPVAKTTVRERSKRVASATPPRRRARAMTEEDEEVAEAAAQQSDDDEEDEEDDEEDDDDEDDEEEEEEEVVEEEEVKTDGKSAKRRGAPGDESDGEATKAARRAQRRRVVNDESDPDYE